MDQVYDISSSTISPSDTVILNRTPKISSSLSPHVRLQVSSDKSNSCFASKTHEKVTHFLKYDYRSDFLASGSSSNMREYFSQPLPVKKDNSFDIRSSPSSTRNSKENPKSCKRPSSDSSRLREVPSLLSRQNGKRLCTPVRNNISGAPISRHPQRNSDPPEVSSSQDDIEINDNSEEENVLSVFWRRGRLGAAYLNILSRELFVMQDAVDIQPEFQLLNTLYYQVRPITLLTSKNQSAKFVDVLRKLTMNDSFSTNESSSASIEDTHSSLLYFVKNQECNLSKCATTISTLQLDSFPEDISPQERRSYLDSCIPHNSEQAMIALGALIAHADTHYRQTRASYSDIKLITLADQLLIDNDTLRGLRVFHEIPHPARNKFGARGTAREGFSIYGIFNRCKSRLGSIRLRSMLQQPSQNKQVLEARYDNIAWCMDPRNIQIVDALSSNISRICNVSTITAKILSNKASHIDWKLLYNSISCAAIICEICDGIARHEDCPPVIRSLSKEMAENSIVHEVSCTLNNTIDLQEMITTKTFAVKRGVSLELDQRMMFLAANKSVVDDIAQVELERLPDFVGHLRFVYIQDIGYFLGIPQIPGITPQLENMEEYGLEFKFSLNNIRHYKNNTCLMLDEKFGAIHIEICQLIAKVKRDVVKYLTAKKHIVQRTIMLCADLDCAIALAKVAIDFSYVRPKLVSEVCLEIKGGRHALQELCTNQFTPNDTYCSRTDGLLKLITGPNASGKSVYLKQVALIVYLAHVGSYVPADSATIGVLRELHSRIRSVYAAARQMSDFQTDLHQLSLAIRSPSRSLLIIDEFGKGTSVLCGRALLQSCLQDLLDRGSECPITLVSTHLRVDVNHLKQTEHLREETFEHTMATNGSLVFLYRLIPGCTTKSFATTVAHGSGMKKFITDRAKNRLEGKLTKEGLQDNQQDLKLLQVFSKKCWANGDVFSLQLLREALPSPSSEEESPISNTQTASNGFRSAQTSSNLQTTSTSETYSSTTMET